MAHGPEKKVKDAIRKLLSEMGAYYYMPVPNGFGKRSLDFVICYKGKFYGCEAKDKGKNCTAVQMNVREDMEAAGGKTCVEDSVLCGTLRRMLNVV